ncbi:unnamed protein product [Cuscuta epithymum]|uniref:Uncharacterized protein n=1 Tax=Cuscuta epithymum TaxID=186058 RepID=A0AAV0F9V1_9ASTE|nr:unnamed protein product [Cuscuta epithymum]
MLKHVDVCKSTAGLKTARMPLRNLSNSKNGARGFSRSSKTKMKLPGMKEHEDPSVCDNSLDRLLLVHSDLSSIVGQIDELVVKALQSKKGFKEINSFANFLSEMQASLKLWLPIFQKPFSDPSTPENVPEEPPAIKDDLDNPEKWDSMVCSSPLVSWRGDCTAESDMQPFLMTPLHQQPKGFSTKLREEVGTDKIAKLPSAFDEMRDTGEDTLLGSAKPENPFILMTPCLKVSPPKSCIVLEPVSEYRHHKGNLKSHRSTPYPVAVKSLSGSQDSDSSDDHAVKYPELLGIKLRDKFENTWKLDEELSKLSPPKTCVLLEPAEHITNDCMVSETSVNPNQEKCLSKNNHTQGKCELVESTPMTKEPERNTQQHPGESTLKRELWTLFEEASKLPIQFDPPSVLKTNLQKGFLDRLEDEVSSHI